MDVTNDKFIYNLTIFLKKDSDSVFII